VRREISFYISNLEQKTQPARASSREVAGVSPNGKRNSSHANFERRCEMSGRNFILEGADVEQKNFAGKPIMKGWRHYRCIFGGRVANVIALEMSPEMAAANYGAKLFQRGQWEDFSRDPLPGHFHQPKFEILEEMEK
jgi:hypothetical protein